MHIFAKSLLLAAFFWEPLSAIIFRHKTSSIELRTNSSIYQVPDSKNIITGKLLFGPSTLVETPNPGRIYPGSQPLYFRNGIYSENGNDLVMTGTLSSLSDYTSAKMISLQGLSKGQSLFDANIVDAVVRVSGAENVIGGRPKFRSPNAVELANQEASLTLATDGDFTSTIALNGGNLLLRNDLQLGESIILTGSGNVSLQGNNIIFGATATTWTSTIAWINANNINLGGNMRLTGLWTFDGDGTVIGANNTLDISHTGTIRIKANSNVELNNLTIQGLGSGTILCDDETSVLTLKNCVINLDNNYTVTAGRWVVASSSTVITGAQYLNFSTGSMLSVSDGSSLIYDTLEFNDNNNIIFLDETPVREAGTIVVAKKLPLGPYRYTTDILLDSDVVITDLRYLHIINYLRSISGLRNYQENLYHLRRGPPPDPDPEPDSEPDSEPEPSIVIDGAQFSLIFARNPAAPVFTIDDDMGVTFTKISLKNFPVDSGSITLGSNAKIGLGDQTTVELGDSATLTTTWYCTGRTMIYGNGKVLTLGTDGNIVLRPGASVLFDNITLNNVHGYNVKCMDNRCTITFGTVLWQQDANYSFTQGKFYVRDRLDLLGTSTFQYATALTSTIASLGELLVNRGMTFKYNPPVAKKSLLQMQDAEAALTLNSSSLAVTTTGMRLTKGTLQVRGKSTLQNQGALSNSQAIIFGDGNTAHDLTIKIDPSAVLDVQSGILLFDQA